MKLGKRVLNEHLEDIKAAYEDDLTPMIEIASWFHVSRQAIHKALRKAGVDTTKRRYPVKCYACGKTFYRVKCQIRKSKHHFCSDDCYQAWLKAGRDGYHFEENRNSSRLARWKVGEVFDLQPEHIVHHEDGKQYNNEWWNLRVFANQRDHVRYHRDCGNVEPIWDGREY